MLNTNFHMPGFRHNEYMLVLDLPETLRHKIENARKGMMEKFKIVQPRTGRPHISLARFVVPQMLEEKVLYRMQVAAMGQRPFRIDLKNYAGYPMHSVIIPIENQQGVLQLIKKLKESRELMKAGGTNPYFLSDPSIPLVGKLEKQQYLEIMKEYEYRSFSGHFPADSMLVLKRRVGEKKYQIVRRFEFQDLQVESRQGLLFS
jgi:2'-5' RNA ligase